MEFVFWLKLAGLFPLFALSLIGPGWPIVRKMRWSPGEKLCASIGASLFLTYLATFIVFLVHWPVQVHWILFAIEAGLTVWYGNEIGQVLRRPFLKKALIYWVVVIAWMFTALLLIRHFSGGLWAGDWWVHARKQAILLSGQIPDYSIASWLLIERPPLMNMAAAHFMAMLGGAIRVFRSGVYSAQFPHRHSLLLHRRSIRIARPPTPGDRAGVIPGQPNVDGECNLHLE